MDIELIKSEISSPALKILAGEILEAVERLRNGKSNYKVALTELAGYKQVLQIMAIEVMRRRIPVGGRE